MDKQGQQRIDGWAMILFVIAAMLIFMDKNTQGGIIVIIFLLYPPFRKVVEK